MKKTLFILFMVGLHLCACTGNTGSGTTASSETATTEINSSSSVPVSSEGNSETSLLDRIQAINNGENAHIQEPPTQPASGTTLNTNEIDFLRVKQPTNGFYLRRNNMFYTLNKFISKKNQHPDIQYDLGFDYNHFNGIYYLYTWSDKVTPNRYIAFGDVPVPIIQKDDLVVAYSDSHVPALTLNKTTPAGYTIGFWKWNFGRTHAAAVDMSVHYFYSSFESTADHKTDFENISITEISTEKELDYENLTHLKYGETYRLSWFEGTNYYELYLPATWRVYEYEPNKADYRIEGTLTKEGFATYDLSGVAPGTYITTEGGLLEIADPDAVTVTNGTDESLQDDNSPHSDESYDLALFSRDVMMVDSLLVSIQAAVANPDCILPATEIELKWEAINTNPVNWPSSVGAENTWSYLVAKSYGNTGVMPDCKLNAKDQWGAFSAGKHDFPVITIFPSGVVKINDYLTVKDTITSE